MALPEDWGDPFDLPAYLDRIGLAQAPTATLAGLEAVCLHHVGAIPFENLDPLTGRTPSLEPARLQAKLVGDRRGGYCFEHNLLLALALVRLGFRVTLREARVAAPTRLGRTHGVLEVAAEGEAWLADVGFGGRGLLGPVPLDGADIRRHGEAWRLRPQARGQLLQAGAGGAWEDLYLLEPGEVYPVDWAVANHYTGSHPDSRFVRTLTVQLAQPGRRRVLRGRTLTTWGQDGPDTREVPAADLAATVRDTFGLEVPPGVWARLPKNYEGLT